MDLEFTDDHDGLRANVRAVLASICPPDLVRRIHEGDDEPAAGVWEQMVALDWPGLAIAEHRIARQAILAQSRDQRRTGLFRQLQRMEQMRLIEP